MENCMKYSVVVPVYNEEDGVLAFLEALRPILEGQASSYEVIVVNDGSEDSTLQKLLSVEWQQLKIVDLISNSGHMAALEAGLRTSAGEFIITMDGDQQHPVELIPQLIELQKNTSCDVVILSLIHI